MGTFLILGALTSATAVLILARKREIAEAFRRAGLRLPSPGKYDPTSRQAPVESTSLGKAGAIIDQGRFGRGLDMDRVVNGEPTPHWGIDITAVEGAPVHVALGGTVRRVEPIVGYGNVVIVEHGSGGRVSLYAHLARAAASVGQQVRGGAVIGYVGRTTHGPNGTVPMEGNPPRPAAWPRSMGPHLHMEVHQSYPPDLSSSGRRTGVLDPVEWLATNTIAFAGQPLARA